MEKESKTWLFSCYQTYQKVRDSKLMNAHCKLEETNILPVFFSFLFQAIILVAKKCKNNKTCIFYLPTSKPLFPPSRLSVHPFIRQSVTLLCFIPLVVAPEAPSALS